MMKSAPAAAFVVPKGSCLRSWQSRSMRQRWFMIATNSLIGVSSGSVGSQYFIGLGSPVGGSLFCAAVPVSGPCRSPQPCTAAPGRSTTAETPYLPRRPYRPVPDAAARLRPTTCRSATARSASSSRTGSTRAACLLAPHRIFGSDFRQV